MHGQFEVSILVFLDTSVPGLLRHQSQTHKLEFQSLFFWIPLFREKVEKALEWDIFVSILVFLDTSVPGIYSANTEAGRYKFQSLFFWIPLFRDQQCREFIREPVRFQSLFFWIPLFRGFCTDPYWSCRICFNPCFSGYLCSGNNASRVGGLSWEFQSLFFWIPLFRVDLGHDPGELTPVSILVFLDTSVPGLLLEADLKKANAVSILVFLDTSVPGGSLRKSATRSPRFNPCFSGYLCSGPRQLHRQFL